jgi:hypothetical protein
MKKVIYVEITGNYEAHKSQEQLLKEHAPMVNVWLADEFDKAWGDDWNDAPQCCNSGPPYEDTVKGLQKITITLGESLPSL